MLDIDKTIDLIDRLESEIENEIYDIEEDISWWQIDFAIKVLHWYVDKLKLILEEESDKE